MNNLAFASITELTSYLNNKKISREELVEFFLRRIEAFDPEIESLLMVYDKKGDFTALASGVFPVISILVFLLLMMRNHANLHQQ